MINNNLLNFAAFFPPPALFMLAEANNQYGPAVLEQQGWIMTAVAAGLAITRIALWLRGSGTGDKSIERVEIANLDKDLSKVSDSVRKMVMEQERIMHKIQNIETSVNKESASTNKSVDEIGRSLQEVKETLRELKFILKRVS